MTDLTESAHAPAAGGASSTAAAAKDQVASVASTAATEAKAVASEAATEAKDVLADARQQLRSQAEEQSAKVAAVVGDIGAQLQKMAAAGESGPARDVVSGVADQARQMSQRLADGGLDRTLADARRLARNRPGLFLAGAALAGFVAARVARAADTDGLKQVVTGSNGSSSSRGAGDLAFRATDPSPRPEVAPAGAAPIEMPR
jgi:hypothetical protein